MVAEVNNTFEERRMYFLPCTPEKEHTQTTKSIEGNHPYIGVLKHKFPKDMHVSPFSSRKGTYSVVAHDILRSVDLPTTAVSGSFVDIKVTLCSSKGRPKLTARLWSVGLPINPAEESYMKFVVFILCWGWVGLVTCKQHHREVVHDQHIF
jgi:DUF1365 family protein